MLASSLRWLLHAQMKALSTQVLVQQQQLHSLQLARQLRQKAIPLQPPREPFGA